MALSRQSIQMLVGLIETHLVEEQPIVENITDRGELRLCRHELMKEWRRQEHEQFKMRARIFSRRQKQLRNSGA